MDDVRPRRVSKESRLSSFTEVGERQLQTRVNPRSWSSESEPLGLMVLTTPSMGTSLSSSSGMEPDYFARLADRHQSIPAGPH